MKARTIPSIHHRLLALAAVLLALAPGRAAADPAAIFVSNYNGGTVSAYSATGIAATGYTAPTGFENPEGLAYNPANNTLYVADAAGNRIYTFNATTSAATQLGFAKAGASSPYGLALNAGVLYAADNGTDTITAYNAANGAAVTTGFTSPVGLSGPIGLAVSGTTLFVVNYNSRTVGAFNLATGTAAAGFTPITGLNGPLGVALYGNDLFVSSYNGNSVGEYDATTGAVINASFVTGLSAPDGLAILGNQLLVANRSGNTVGAYGIPAVTTLNNMPTSATPSFLTGLGSPSFIAVVVPEPSTWALLGLGAGLLGFMTQRRRRA